MHTEVSNSRKVCPIERVASAVLALTLALPAGAADADGLLGEVRECASMRGTGRTACFEAAAGKMAGGAGQRMGPAATDFVRCAALELERVREVCFDAAAESLAATPAESQDEPARPAGDETGDNDRIARQGTGHASIANAVDNTNLHTDIGNEQLRSVSATRDEQPKRSASATVVSVSRNPLGLHSFHLSNGQVWQQTERERFVVPDGEFAVRIREGAISGYRLSLESQNKILRVKRVR